jgi:hypothetical protein
LAVSSLHSDSPLTLAKVNQRLSRLWLESRYSQLLSTDFRTSWLEDQEVMIIFPEVRSLIWNASEFQRGPSSL